MDLGPCARAFVRLGVVLLLVAAVAGVWEMLAMQIPSSQYRVGVLPGPIGQLREMAVVIALVLFAGAWLMPWLAPDREPWLLCVAVHVGALVTLGAMAYGATTGMYGVQIYDPRLESQVLFIVRWAGQAVLGLCLLDFARRILFRRAPS